MARYITKRVLRSLITLFIIITILFALLRLRRLPFGKRPVKTVFNRFNKNWYQSRYRCCFRRSSTGTGSEKLPVEQYRIYAALREAPK